MNSNQSHRLAKTIHFERLFLVRQPIILFFALLPLLISFLLRFLIPLLNWVLNRYLNFDLTPYYDLIFLIVLFMAPGMLGSSYGYMLLDETDQKTLGYYAVLPIGLPRYVIRRMVSAFLASLILVPITAWVFGWDFSRYASPLSGRFAGLTIILALEAPVYALAVSSIARNKLEGLSASKLISQFSLTPILPFFVTSPWRFVGGIIPFYWPAELYLHGGVGVALVALVYHGFACWFMLQIKLRRTHVMV